MNFKQAFMAAPGPRNMRQAAMLWAKGVCMGVADIIPGVSGGTIAFITGIYDQLLAAISSFNLAFIKKLLRFDVKAALAETHIRFLICLLLGIAVAMVSAARVVHHLLAEEPVFIWAFFFGLIAASIIVVGREARSIKQLDAFIFTLFGTALGYFIVGLIPVQTPETWWFIFLSGMISICAMILPGISGSFILLILGKYALFTGALKNPFSLDSLYVLVFFFSGAAMGLAGFSRVLGFLLGRFRIPTVATLTGFMLGAMRKIWPWKEIVETKEIRGKTYVLLEENILPPAWDSEVLTALGLAVLGFIMVMALDIVSRRSGARSKGAE